MFPLVAPVACAGRACEVNGTDLCSGRDQFQWLASLGGELVTLHLMEDAQPARRRWAAQQPATAGAVIRQARLDARRLRRCRREPRALPAGAVSLASSRSVALTVIRNCRGAVAHGEEPSTVTPGRPYESTLEREPRADEGRPRLAG